MSTEPFDRTQFAGEVVERLVELGQKSSVRIDTTAKGQAQIKVSIYKGDTEEDLQLLVDLAVKTYTDVQSRLGRIAQFS